MFERENTSLTTLNLFCNKIGDAGKDALVVPQKCHPSLRILLVFDQYNCTSTLAPSEFFLTIFCALKIRFGGKKSVPIKRATKTILLHSCDIEKCEETLVERGEIKKRGQKYCVAGEPNDIKYENDRHTTGISIHYFPKDVAVWPK